MTTMLLFEQNRTDGQKVDFIYWLIYLTCPLIGGVFAGILWRMHASVLQEQAKGLGQRIPSPISNSFEREELGPIPMKTSFGK